MKIRFFIALGFSMLVQLNVFAQTNTAGDKVTEKDGYQIFASAGFKVKCGCKLYVDKVFIDMATKQGVDNILAAYLCAENEDNPDICAIVNILIYDMQKIYKNIPEKDYQDFETQHTKEYAEYLKSSGISSYNFITYQGVSAIEYTYKQIDLPTKAIYFLKRKKAYLLQIGTRKNLTTKYNSLKNSFEILK
ncbi:MAG: hypothetical protein LBR10_13160 [Prevotellaceae bacterium]|jgi:hypothetical protein|nr:hypothetical protein [Prevotellaceae bacterium]